MSRLRAAEASEIFNKETLVQQHETAARSHVHLQAGSPFTSVADPVPRLRPIRLRELNVGRTHLGRVLFGTLCVDPFKNVGIMTVLQDDQGLAIRVAVYNVASSGSSHAALNALNAIYPKGAKVAIMDPYFKRDEDGDLAIRVDNPANLVRITGEVTLDIEPMSELERECGKGNKCFRGRDWRGAVTHYTNCILAPNDGEAAKQARLLAYSNRAETYLQMGEFKRALEDSEQSLGIEPTHLKTLYRKGRALHGLEDYAQACQVLQTALQLGPGQADIEDALRRSRASCARSRQGEYDISAFLLGMQPPGKIGDFVGDVEIKKTRDGRRRGLYATENVSTGELLLVSNAVAIDDIGLRPFKFDDRDIIEVYSSQEDLVAAVISAAEKSQKLLQQLYTLDDGSEQVRASTPATDLFDVNCPETTEMPLLQIDKPRIRLIVSRNSLAGEGETSDSSWSWGFSGLWLLPSFINHSCLPNTTRLNVGRAMFLHAAKPIGKGEEITISYFDALLPLSQRESMSQVWSFKCNCKRCALEKSLGTLLKSLNAQFEALHNKALEETNHARSSGKEFPTKLPKSAEFAKVYEKMEKRLCKDRGMKAEEKNWVRASYVTAYWAGTQSDEFFDKILEDPIPSGDEILEAVVNTVPGDLRTLAMAAHQAEGVRQWIGNAGWAIEYCAKQARDACVRVLGKHSEHIIEALIHRHAKSAIF
ncbi:hypothetical protein SUGI_0493140 [Cryptomeria japonica]|uniref:methyltransferase FGSG_00040-like n=1 Tax=Cryptomeria japonica TaxID=3369 RepID=UPI002408C202|nr:methyltransferase FGSG_00040-like [Cryptomeria japonica]GLJ25756.1 hypothetical protein SUGI_0493140 [Cryptomeria japonica]